MPISLPSYPVRFMPSKDTLKVLNERKWICSYSGGKDSTSLVTWIEWLRRVGLVKVETPRLVMSDTTVEYPFLRGIADRLMATLTECGWACEVVTPRINERLYNRIFGIGNSPVHPGNRKGMRWCTKATKIDPMKRFSKTLGKDILQLSGVRWGESDARDGKLSAKGCAAGGECGLPDPGEGVFGPIITWTTCKVVEWLNGQISSDVNDTISDLLPMTRELVGVYDVKIDEDLLFGTPPRVISSLRFGCVGCPAISREKVTRSSGAKAHPRWVYLQRIWQIWQELYLRANRCCRYNMPNRPGYTAKRKPGHVGYGPIRMESRKRYFAEIMQIQRDSGVTLVTPEDEAFIRDCWERKVYPRGWSEADELVEPPTDEGLFEGMA